MIFDYIMDCWEDAPEELKCCYGRIVDPSVENLKIMIPDGILDNNWEFINDD